MGGEMGLMGKTGEGGDGRKGDETEEDDYGAQTETVRERQSSRKETIMGELGVKGPHGER